MKVQDISNKPLKQRITAQLLLLWLAVAGGQDIFQNHSVSNL